MISFDVFQCNVNALNTRVEAACSAAGRTRETVTVLPVTKTHPIEAAIFSEMAGFEAVGENRVQEAVEKIRDPRTPPGLRWELIGHLQSNKAAAAVDSFDRIQSLDSAKLARRLDRFAGERDRKPAILLQVNAGDDPAKYGIGVADAPGLVETVLGLSRLKLEGLMTIAPLSDDREVARRCFARLRELRDQLEEEFGVKLAELSMGMTGDLEEAVKEGSTQLRVGTALFGERER